MARYSINVRTKSYVADPRVVEPDSLTKVRIEMARCVGELLSDHAEQIWADQDWQVDVSDQTGLILYVMHISAAETAATMNKHRSHPNAE